MWKVEGTPALANVGPNAVTIQATDNNAIPASSTQAFSINVASSVINVNWNGTGDYTTIQAGIDNAVAGDIIVVANGTYNECIDFKGKNIAVLGNTANPSLVTINGGAAGSVVSFKTNETSAAELNGFTITNGSGTVIDLTAGGYQSPNASYGGGVYCFGASPTLSNVIVTVNKTTKPGANGGSGAGIYIGGNSNVKLSTSEISNNTNNLYRGGGICIDNSSLTMTDVVIKNNTAGNYGGGIAAWNSTLTMNNVSINNNTASGINGTGGGVFVLNTVHNLTSASVSGNTATIKGNGVYSVKCSGASGYFGVDQKIIFP
jgi:predicted outer membrane repeat protein